MGWERFLEKVGFESGVENSGCSGWWQWWWWERWDHMSEMSRVWRRMIRTRLMEWSRNWFQRQVAKNLKCFRATRAHAHRAALISVSVDFSHQSDTSRSCKSADTARPVCRAESLECLLPAYAGTNLYCLMNRGTCVRVNNLPTVRLLSGAERPGLEPATSQLQVRRPNHYATTPQKTSWRI